MISVTFPLIQNLQNFRNQLLDVLGSIADMLAVLNPGDRAFSSTVNTTDATVTAVATLAVPANTTLVIEALIAARRTGGAAGTTGDAAGYVAYCAAKNIAGTVTIVGQALDFTAEDQAGWTAAFAVATTNIELRVTGAANNNITWTAAGKALAA
jgi:hypothetical protein